MNTITVHKRKRKERGKNNSIRTKQKITSSGLFFFIIFKFCCFKEPDSIYEKEWKTEVLRL